MKVGDLVQSRWPGSGPRRVGMITAIRRFTHARIKWFGIDDDVDDKAHVLLRYLELINESR